MSRQIQHKVGEGDDEQNKQITIITPERIRLMTTHVTLTKDGGLLERIRRTKNIDEALKDAVAKVQKNKLMVGKNELKDWELRDGLPYYKGYVYVPSDEELRRDVVHRHHNTMVAGHPGESKILKLLARNYRWPRMGQSV